MTPVSCTYCKTSTNKKCTIQLTEIHWFEWYHWTHPFPHKHLSICALLHCSYSASRDSALRILPSNPLNWHSENIPHYHWYLSQLNQPPKIRFRCLFSDISIIHGVSLSTKIHPTQPRHHSNYHTTTTPPTHPKPPPIHKRKQPPSSLTSALSPHTLFTPIAPPPLSPWPPWKET